MKDALPLININEELENMMRKDVTQNSEECCFFTLAILIKFSLHFCFVELDRLLV